MTSSPLPGGASRPIGAGHHSRAKAPRPPGRESPAHSLAPWCPREAPRSLAGRAPPQGQPPQDWGGPPHRESRLRCDRLGSAWRVGGRLTLGDTSRKRRRFAEKATPLSAVHSAKCRASREVSPNRHSPWASTARQHPSGASHPPADLQEHHAGCRRYGAGHAPASPSHEEHTPTTEPATEARRGGCGAPTGPAPSQAGVLNTLGRTGNHWDGTTVAPRNRRHEGPPEEP